MDINAEALNAAIATMLRDRRTKEQAEDALAREHRWRLEQQASALAANNQLTRVYARVAELEAELDRRTNEWYELCEAHRLVHSGVKVLDKQGRVMVKVD